MDAQRWDAKTTRRFPGEPTPRPTSPPRKRKLLWATLAALTVAAVAVSATQTLQDDRQIGVCHATASETDPYVFLVVKEDGFEHGHHRHHEDDFFVTDLSRGCQGDDPAVPAPDNGTEPANETGEPSGEEPTNETAPAPVPAGDAAVRQTATQDDFLVVLTLRVQSLGDGAAQGVSLDDQLPELRRSWQLAGTDAADCVLDGRSLSCWFGDLAPGEERVVELRAYTDRMPCGFALTNTAFVSSVDDAEARNDASSASIAARAC